MALGQDVLALSFAMSVAQLTSTATPGGYFFVFMERPGEPKFGLDELTPTPAPGVTIPAPTSWNDLSWDYMQTVRGSNLTIDPANKPQALTGAIQHVTTSAQLAFALLREPVMVAIHALDLLPPSTTNSSSASS